MLAYWLMIAYLAVDYLQPGVRSQAIAALRPALIVGGLLVAAGLFYTVGGRTQPVLFPRQSKLFLVLLMFMAISTPAAFVRQSALDVLILMVKMFTVYFVLTQVVDTPWKLKSLLYAFVSIHVWVAFEGIQAFYSPLGREGAGRLTGALSGFLGNNNDFALALVVIVPFAYFLMLYSKSWLTKAALLGSLTIFAAGIMATVSRGGQLGLLAVLGVIAIKSKWKTPVVVTVLCLGGLFGSLATDAYWKRMQGISDYQDDLNARSRLYTWSVAVDMALANPLLGVGPGNFQNVYGRQFVSGRPEGVSGGWVTAHSVYFQVMSELGFTALAIFVALLMANFRTCSRLMELGRSGKLTGAEGEIVTAAAAACFTGLVGFLTSGAFLSAAYYPHLWYLTAFIVVTEGVAREVVPTYIGNPVQPTRPPLPPGEMSRAA
jgi:probable O-glycosylation ligase (exosortase A-associated)